MTLDELPGYLRMIRDRALADGARAAANGMGEVFERDVKAALTKRSHVRPTRTPSPPGEPPAMESGTLAGSVTMVPAAGGGASATSKVGPHVIYDAVQEYGAVIYGKPVMRFQYGSDFYQARKVTLPARPYMRPTVAKDVANGSLTEAAARAFYEAVWG